MLPIHSNIAKFYDATDFSATQKHDFVKITIFRRHFLFGYSLKKL